MRKVTPTFSNVPSKINYMYSDGPEDINAVNVPCTLLANKENSIDSTDDGNRELLLPESIELAAYHNNYSAGKLFFGFVVHNSTSSTVRISIKSYEKISLPGSTTAETMKIKVKNNAEIETVFANFDGFQQDEKISVGANGYAIIYLSSIVNAQNSINTRMRIRTLRTDGECFYGRFVCFRPNSDNTTPMAKELWEATNAKYPAGADGQFTGIVNYLDKAVDVTVNNEGDYFTLFNTESYADGGKNSTEFDGVIYHKPNGKNIFAGNYGVIYKVTLRHPKNSGYKLKITPYSANSGNLAFSLVKCLDGDYSYEAFNNGTPLTRKDANSAWSDSYFIPLSNTAYDEFDLILPAANCGVIHCEYIKA